MPHAAVAAAAAAPAEVTVRTIAGDGTCGYRDGPAAQTQVEDICCFALDAAGNLIFSDFGNDRIRKLSANLQTVTTLAGGGNVDYYSRFRNGPAESAAFYGPIGIAIDRAGNVLIADGNNHRVCTIESLRVVVWWSREPAHRLSARAHLPALADGAPEAHL
eukprot:m.165387 g.165387  ORF g.165387 m.165387 type:complete len:161 (+) comp14672_c0_seq1:294-776(+)